MVAIYILKKSRLRMSIKNEVPHLAGPHLAYETIAPLLMMQYFDSD